MFTAREREVHTAPSTKKRVVSGFDVDSGNAQCPLLASAVVCLVVM